MLSYCVNRLEISPQPSTYAGEVPGIVASLQGENGPLDFETVLPVPPAIRLHHIDITDDNPERVPWEAMQDDQGRIHLVAIPAATLEQCRKELGYDHSEAWCAAHWGTMRNAFCGEGKWHDNRFTFATISRPPLPFVFKLSRKYPNHIFKLFYAEPNAGINGYTIACRGCEWMVEDFPADSDQGIANLMSLGFLDDPDDDTNPQQG